MKKVFHKIASFSLALVVLLSTVSFTVDSHYCGGILVDSSLFGHVETCGMEVQQQLPTSECEISIEDCCSDEEVVIEGQDTLKTSFDRLEKDQQLFVATFCYTYFNLFDGLDTSNVPFRDYAPPFLIRDIQKLHETYLI